jgi:phosphomannomutase / phosphoglucomutase
MARIFSLLSILAVILIITAGASAYWFSIPDIKQAKKETSAALARGIALNLGGQLKVLQLTLDRMAQMPEVIATMKQQDPQSLNDLGETLKNRLPYAMNIRLLPALITEPDQTQSPHMGFADLEMVQTTLKKPQLPVIQGGGEHRHLAMTSLISENGQPLGVILASLRYGFVTSAAKSSGINEGFLEIMQQRATLSSAGNTKDKTEDEETIRINHSDWEILFWPAQHTTTSELTLILSSIGLASLLACLTFFMGYRKLTELFRQDQSSIIKATKDLLNGKIAGNYPVNLNEMKPIISTIVQYKRVLDNKGNVQTPDTELDFDDGFFDDGLDTSFLDINRGVEVDEEYEAEANAILDPEPSPPTSRPVPMPVETPPADFGTTVNMDNIFRAYDIRGIVDKTLTADIVHKIGQAIGSQAKALSIKTIIVGRDGRRSSRSFSASLIEGIVSTGRDVMDIGLVPTPVLYFVTQHTEGRSGAMITGSHNPPDYNGVKVVINGETLADKKIKHLQHLIESGDFATGERGTIEQNTMFTNEYIGIIAEDIHIVRPMKIVLDCGNGAASDLAPTLLRTIGCEVIELYCEIDGSFPNHHPDPSNPENLRDLITAVKHHEADVGIALDGDGDRLGIIDSSGNIIWPDRQMMLFAKDILANKPGAEIIFDVKCSRHLTDQIIKFGGRPLMWKSGHSLLKSKLKETNAALAGELSGHFMFNDRWFGFDDGLYSAARMIELLSADSRRSSLVFAELPDSVNTPELAIPMPESESKHFMEQMFMKANFQDGNILNIDGMRVEFDDGWGMIKASNTTPSLVMRFEADNDQALTRIQIAFKKLMQQIKPDLTIPF